jgi:hypothetical protein
MQLIKHEIQMETSYGNRNPKLKRNGASVSYETRKKLLGHSWPRQHWSVLKCLHMRSGR